MSNELLLFFKKHTDTLIEQTKSRPQETLDFKMKKQMETFSVNRPIKLLEEGKWFLAVTCFEATNSVFNITDENNSFSISIPFYWIIPNYLMYNIIDKLKNLLKLKFENDIELHVNDVRERSKKNQFQRIYFIRFRLF